MAACIFCRIIAGTLPAEVVLDEPGCVGVLDHRPLFAGHVLIMPRVHVETLMELGADQIQPIFGAAQRVARAVEEATAADGIFVAINNKVSQSVPHLHVHVVPRRKKDGLRGFFWPRITYGEGEMARVGAEIRAALQGL